MVVCFADSVWRHTHNSEASDWGEWTLNPKLDGAPIQTDGYDCGLFVVARLSTAVDAPHPRFVGSTSTRSASASSSTSPGGER